ncbi:MAG: lysophospholipid acyltransferase family protein [Planctomycetaceae bacterium]
MDKWTWKDKILLAVVPFLGSLLLRLFSLTIQKKTLYGERFEKSRDPGRPVIGAFWHQRLLMMPFFPRPGKTGMLISQHRDGEIIARLIKYLGIDSVRGSTTRGGFSALRGMVRFYREGGNLAITPDGPQGPKHVVQPGVIELARLTGSPIFPMTYGASRKKALNSWDHFIVPIPFCRIVYIWGEPVWVPRESKPEEMEEKRLLLQDRLRQITEEADCLFQNAP